MTIKFLARAATPTIQASNNITAFNKPEMKKIRESMKGFGFKLTHRTQIKEKGAYTGAMEFSDKFKNKLSLLAEQEGNFITTTLVQELGMDVNNFQATSSFDKKTAVLKSLAKLVDIQMALTSVNNAVEFLANYVGTAKPPTNE